MIMQMLQRAQKDKKLVFQTYKPRSEQKNDHTRIMREIQFCSSFKKNICLYFMKIVIRRTTRNT